MGRGQGRRHRGAGGRDDRGAAAVEFALVALPLFLILFGIIQYGFLFYQIQGAAAASKDAAVWAAQGIDGDAGCSAWLDRAKKRAEGYGVDAGSDPQITADFELGAPGGSTVTVTVSFTPLALAPLVPVPDTVVQTATMDVESFPLDAVTGTCGP